MDNRERIIRLWFDMWLTKKDLGISDIFSNNAIYIESWGPEYHGIKKIILWFEEWNTRGTVLQWDIKQFFHKDNQTIVEWYFKNKMDDGNVEAFDGISLIEWTPDDKIALLKEFGCNENRYDPDLREAHKDDFFSVPEDNPLEDFLQTAEETTSPDSDPEQAAMAFICKRLKLNYGKLSEEERKWLKRIAQKSDLLKNPKPQRGRK